MYKQREKIIVLFSLLLLLGGVIPGQAQKDNRFEVSKNLDIFNALVKEVEMFYVDSVDVEKTVRRGIDAMLGGLDPYTEYYPEQEMDKLKFMTANMAVSVLISVNGKKAVSILSSRLKECRLLWQD